MTNSIHMVNDIEKKSQIKFLSCATLLIIITDTASFPHLEKCFIIKTFSLVIMASLLAKHVNVPHPPQHNYLLQQQNKI